MSAGLMNDSEYRDHLGLISYHGRVLYELVCCTIATTPSRKAPF